MQSGIFATTHKAWHQHPINQKTWIDFQSFWGKKFHLKRDVAQAAGTFGFSNNTTGTSELNTASFDESIDKFAAAHNATQLTINGPAATYQQLAAMNHQLQQQLANQRIAQQQMMIQIQGQP